MATLALSIAKTTLSVIAGHDQMASNDHRDPSSHFPWKAYIREIKRLVGKVSEKFTSRNSHLAYNLACLGEKNGHVAYRLLASKLVRSYSQVLALRRRDKGKPAARRGRKIYGPPGLEEVAGLSNSVGGATKLRPQRGEGADSILSRTQPYECSASSIF